MNRTNIADPLQIVRCTHAHAPQIAALLYRLYLELDEGDEQQAAVFLNEEMIRAILSEGKTVIVAAQDHDQVIGMITLTENSALYAGGSYGSIDELYIKPEYRCRNIGGRLVDEAKKIAGSKGWGRIVVHTPRDNDKWSRTIRFYERNGFDIIGNVLKFSM